MSRIVCHLDCKEIGYETGTNNILEGNKCLLKTCTIINNIKNCKSEWVRVGEFKGVGGKA
jgi:hypothetical protein